jgi:hypothetical protein
MHGLPGSAVNVAVYTAIFGDYDHLEAPFVVGDADYFCFTDVLFDAPDPWRVVVVHPIPPIDDSRRAARYFFLQSTLVLSEYEYTICHGGNTRLKVAPAVLLEYLHDDVDIAAFQHPHRTSVYDEPGAINALGLDTPEHMDAQMARYQDEGFPGMPFSACILLVRHNTPRLREFEAMWWAELCAGSHRDQLSFDYCRWKLDVPINYIPGNCFVNPIMERNAHAHLR